MKMLCSLGSLIAALVLYGLVQSAEAACGIYNSNRGFSGSVPL
jgi:hypothetical protein